MNQLTKIDKRRRGTGVRKLEPKIARRSGSKRVPQSDRRQESMTLILDQAEALFAELGFNGATLKEVASDAGVDPALMRYYFGDKQRLFKAVFERRAPEINELRQTAMANYRRAAKGKLELEPIIDAFMRPAFEKMADDDGWRNYMAIVSYVNASRGFLDKLMSEAFDHVSLELIADFRTIFPDANDDELFWCYQFLTGAYTFSLGRTGRVDRLSGGLCSSSDVLAIIDRLPTFLAAGIRGALGKAVS